ncbi:MAG: thioredoxin family protein [Planctomycetes bacterium]|nr:thioredoxin family protein [Planctomycetota bacterium]
MDTRKILSALLTTAIPLLAQHGDGWTSDVPAARASAAEHGRDVLLVFTGSDWCSPCIRLAAEVWSRPEFVEAARERYELVIVDNPRGEDVISAEQRQANDALHALFAVNSWPTVVLTDAEGRPFARTKDYRAGGPAAWLEHLAELQRNRAERDRLFAAAAAVEGVERARLLDQGLRACGDFIPTGPYADVIDRILAADADNETGLAMRWRTRRAADALENDLPALGKSGRWAELVARIDEFLARYEPDDVLRQKTLYWRGVGLARTGDAETAKASFEAAVALGADAEYGRRSQAMLGRINDRR